MGVLRVAVAQEVPRGVHEGVHGVGVTLGRAATPGTVHLTPLPSLDTCQRRGALGGQIGTAQIGQLHRQLLIGNGDVTAGLAVDDGDRAAPEALPAEQPVTQPVGDGRLTDPAIGEELTHLRDGLGLVLQSVEHARILVGTITRGRHPGLAWISLPGVDDRDHLNAIASCEVEVSLVVRGHGHDGTRSVVGEHVVASPHRDLRTIDRVGGLHPQVDAGLLVLGGLTLDLGLLLHLFEVLLEGWTLLVGDDLVSQSGVGGDDHERGTEQGVRASGEHTDRLVAPIDAEVDVGALGSSDPVALHGEDAIGPVALEPVHVVEQTLGVVGDLEVPLIELTLGDDGATTVAAAVLDLLVGQHGLVVGAPVGPRVLAVGQPLLEELQEEPLGPVVVLLVGGVQSLAPVEGDAVAAE